MRLLLATALLCLPMLAHAEDHAEDRIPDSVLVEHNNACMDKCFETRSQVYCAELCSCMTGEMKRHWTAAEYQERTARLSDDLGDAGVQDEMSRLAQYCARRSAAAVKE